MTEEQYEFENDYLTMVRIMEKEWESWKNNNPNYRTYTGFEQLQEKTAYQAGFMAGFSGRYFNESD